MEDAPVLLSWVPSKAELLRFAGPVFQYPLTHSQLITNLDDPSRYAYVLEAGEEMTGYGEIYLKPQCIHLARLIIGPEENRGKGFGTQLVQHLLQEGFRRFPREHAELNVYLNNPAAVRCYEKLGFKEKPGLRAIVKIDGEDWEGMRMIRARQPLQS